MTAKEYLTQYDSYKRKYKRYLSEYRSEAEVIRDIQKNLNTIPALKRREAEERLKRVILFCNGLKDRTKESACRMDEIQAMIESIPGLGGEILQLRYIDGLIWEDVCERVFYSWNTVFKNHHEAMQMIEERLDIKQHRES